MRMPKSGPGDGPKKVRDSFTHWKAIEGGERHFAYVAGQTHWVIGHPSDKGSKPCLRWATKDALPCRFCRLDKAPCEFGYVPVYRAVDYRPMFVIVYSEEREWIDQCEVHDRVQIGREKEKGARLWVRRSLTQEPSFTTTILYRKCAQDIEDSLLAVWGIPELVSYLRCAASDNAVSPTKAVPVKSDGDEFSDMTSAAAKRYDTTGDSAMRGGTDAAVNRLLEHAKRFGGKPSTNGHHSE